MQFAGKMLKKNTVPVLHRNYHHGIIQFSFAISL